MFISETATDKVGNTPPTAASMGSDLNGMAVLHACEQLRDRYEAHDTHRVCTSGVRALR